MSAGASPRQQRSHITRIPEPADLNRRRPSGNDARAGVERVATQVDQDVDLECAQPACCLVVGQPRDVEEVVEGRAQSAIRGINVEQRTGKDGKALEVAVVMRFDQFADLQTDRTLPQVGREPGDPGRLAGTSARHEQPAPCPRTGASGRRWNYRRLPPL